MILLFLAEMVGGKRWDIFLMIRIVDVPWCSRPHRHKAHRYMPSRRWCNRSWISRTCRLGSLKSVQTIYTDPSRKIFEATWKSQGVDGLQPEYKRTLVFLVFVVDTFAFSVLFSGMSCRWVSSCTSFARRYWHDLFRWAQHSAADAASIFSRAWCCSPPGKITYDDVTIDVFILQK